MSVFNLLNAAIYTRLVGGTALMALLADSTSVYYQQAPDDATLDYVVFSLQGGGDENLTPHRTKNLLVFVRGYSRTSGAKAGQIDAAADALLHGVELTVTGWQNFWLHREDDQALIETDQAGHKTHMAGGLYRVRLEKE
jgi:hypothetical protein